MAVAFRANPPAEGEPRELVVEADGGSRGNPGVAAGGSVVIDPVTGEVLAELGVYVGITTNNVAVRINRARAELKKVMNHD